MRKIDFTGNANLYFIAELPVKIDRNTLFGKIGIPDHILLKTGPLTEEEKQVYINENKEVPPYKSDSSTLEHFGKMGFLKALNYLEVI